MGNNQNSKNKQQAKKKWYENKKARIGFCALLGASMLTAILAPTLVAVSKRSTGTVAVTFNANGGTIMGGAETKTVNVGKGQTFDALAATKSGYTLSGWTKEDGTTWDFSKDTTTVAITLTAQWASTPVVTQYTIHFQDNHADEPVPDQLINKGGHVAKPSIKKTGYKLLGWKYEGKETGYWDFETDTVPGPMTLVADWTEDPTSLIKVTFKKGDHGSLPGGVEYIDVDVTRNIAFGNISDIPAVTPDQGYFSSGWCYEGTETKIGANDKIADNTVLVAAYETQVSNMYIKQGLDETYSIPLGWTYTGGKTQLSTQITSGQKFSDIKANLSLPNYDTDRYEFKYWSLNQTSPQAQLADDTVLDTDTTIYPCFALKDYPVQSIPMQVILKDEQYLVEGDLNFTVDYIAPISGQTEPQLVHTFSEVNKPTLKRDGKEFSGWYKADPTDKDPITDAEWFIENAWNDDDKITPTSGAAWEVYAYFTTVNSICQVSFEAESTDDVLWVGNQNVTLSSEDDHTFSAISKPLPFKDYDGDVTTGFTSPWYLTGWHLKGGGDVPDTISTSITVCPDFAAKPKITFETDDTGSATKEITIDPVGTWSELKNLPQANYTSTAGNSYFVGWKYITTYVDPESGETIRDEHIIKPTTLVKSVTNYTETTHGHILPNYISNVNTVTFSKDGVDTQGNGVTVEYEGTWEKVAVDRTANVNFMYGVNKPTVKETSAYKFVKWQIYKYDSSTQTWKWEDATYDDEIAATEAGSETTTKIRPVVETKFTVNFDPGTDGEIIPLEDEEQTVLDSTLATSSDLFRSIYVPDIKPNTNKIFSHWAYLKDGNYIKLNANDNVPSPGTGQSSITLYAIYVDDLVSSVVNFNLFDEDKYDTDFPATISGTKTVVNHTLGNDPAFSTIAKATATKYLHEFKEWVFADGTPVASTYTVPPGEDGINVYATFKQSTEYWCVKIKDTSEFEFLTDNVFYIKTGQTLPVNTDTGEFGIKMKWVGHMPKGYKYTDAGGTEHWLWDKTGEHTAEPVLENISELEVVWDDEAKKQVTFSKNGDSTITLDGIADGEGKNCDYYGKLLEFVNTNCPHPARGTDVFDSWKVTDSNGTQTLTSTYEITENVTVYPTFIGESEFAESDKPYYYDIEAGKWAQILSFEGETAGTMTIAYAGGTQKEVDKSTFNYNVKLGNSATSIPDNFMQGCVHWNNGSTDGTAQPLTFSNINSVGKNFLQGCASFNQDVTISGKGLSTGYTDRMVIRPNFMRDCQSFNSNVQIEWSDETVSTDHRVYIDAGFMHNCQNFTGQIWFHNCYILNGASDQPEYPDWVAEGEELTYWNEQISNWYSILSSDNAYSKMYTQGFTVKLDKDFWPDVWTYDTGKQELVVKYNVTAKIRDKLLADLNGGSTVGQTYRKVKTWIIG